MTNSNWVGIGWRMGSEWADATSLLGRVIKDGLATSNRYNGSTDKEEEGSTETEISNKLAVSAKVDGSYGMFSASVETSFSQASSSFTSQYYRLVYRYYGCHAIRINKTPASLIKDNDLSPEFTNALTNVVNEESVTQLFKSFGTHVVVGALEGGIIQAGYHATSTENKTSSQFSSEVSASYGALISGTAGVEASSSIRVGSTEMSLLVQGRGGKNASSVPGGGKDAYNEWETSVEENPTIINFLEHGLIPLWEFCADAPKRLIIMNHYISLYGIWPALKIRVFRSTSGHAAHPEATVTVPREYKVISGGARVEFSGAGQLLTSSAPDPRDPRKWTAKSKDHEISDPGTVTAFAVGLWDPDDLWEVKVFENTSDKAQHPVTSVTVDADYVMTGGGATDNWKGQGNLLVGMYPSSNNEWTAIGKDHDLPSPSTITAFAIGIRPRNSELEVPPNRLFESTGAKAQHPTAIVDATGLWGLVGGGAKDLYIGMGNMLTASFPSPIDQIAEWSVAGKDHIHADSSSIRAYGIGIEGVVNISEDPTT